MPRAFYARGAVTVARDLLGRVLVCDAGGVRVAGVIAEVEAYRAGGDPASHAYRGVTPRNRVMFGPPGHAYVYFTYGMHHCLNLVCEPEGRAAAVLVRALEPLEGLDAMRERRGVDDVLRLARGPGCVAQALALTREHDGADLLAGPVRVLDGPRVRPPGGIARGPRIGIRHGLDRAWRFFRAGDPFVSAGGAGTRQAVRRGHVPR
ncbi:MAG: DNA-3-methyladenine glycosylase [Candidatus Eisenbacteria bacterium]